MDMENTSVIDASEPVSKAVNELESTGLPVIVTKDGKYFGIIDERAIRQHISSSSKEKCGTIAERTPTLTPESTVLDACNAFFAGRFKAIPVLKNGKVAGAITRHTLLNELLSEKMLTRKRVNEVMTSPVASIDMQTTIGHARAELRRHNIRRLVVTEKGKIAGLLSVFDLAKFVTSKKESSAFYRGGEKTSMDSQPIASYIKKQVETIGESDSLANAVKKMLDARVSALIVSEGGFPRGIVTAKDILHSALAEDKPASVFVSGLPYGQRDMQSEIAREGAKLISRLGKSSDVHSLAFHIKSEGSGFNIRARLDGRKSYNASASDFRLEVALGKVLDELHKMAERDKSSIIGKRKGRGSAGEE
ncbi:Inosine-5'-monophosphate dehydrogenase [uncultured archaeon]|nr:Inosine-5'-monophosphate dehydrogenase [uncultured archaeon]